MMPEDCDSSYIHIQAHPSGLSNTINHKMNQLFLTKTNGFNFYMLGVGVTNLKKKCSQRTFFSQENHIALRADWPR